ncbi:MAG: tetratricopeptide repeat protein [Candidatus Cloacimonetes bacterium]|nr:tetratricopeptide repeat protein [Candidatus Cloacimonadota bacterium]
MRSLVPDFILRKARDKHYRGSINGCVLRVTLRDCCDISQNKQPRSLFEESVIHETIHLILDPILEVIDKNGGFTTGMVGESITGIFPGKNGISAINAAISIRDLLQKINIQHPECEEKEVPAFIGLAFGQVSWQILPAKEQSLYWFSGPAMKKAVESQNLSIPNQILLDQSILSVLDDKKIKTKKIYDKFSTLISSDLPKVENKILRSCLSAKAFVPRYILDKDNIREFRNVICCIVNLKKPLEKQIQAIKDLSAKYDGYINNIEYSDKGWTGLIAFGISETNEDIAKQELDFINELITICKNNLRVGLTYGKVYAGIIGTENVSNYCILGIPVKIAYQSMVQAKWGEIRCGKNFFKKLRNRVAFEPLGPLLTEGYYKFTDNFLLLLRHDSLRDTQYQTDFIGRTRELDQLEKSCKPLWQNRYAGITYIFGEAGQGKTRIVHEFKKKVGEKAECFTLKTFADHQIALNPFANWIRQIFSSNITGSLSARRKDFREHWSKFRQKIIELPCAPETIKELDRIESIIAGIIGLDWKGSIYTKLDSKQRLSGKIFALKSLLEIFCLFKPVILVMEDLHWLDQESIEIIKVLSGKGTKTPFKFIITSRKLENGEYPHLQIDDETEAEKIYLKGLELNQVGSVMKSILQKDVSHDIVEHVYSISNGNPFIVEEITRYFHDADKLILLGDRYYQKDSLLDLPKRVKSFIQGRINRLEPQLKKTIQIASILGNEFSVELLCKIVASVAKQGNDLNESLIKEYVELGEKEYIWHVLSDNKYAFNHALLRDVIYQMLLKKEQKILNLLAAKILNDIYPGDQSISEKIAEHYEKANEREKAILYYTKAGYYEKEQYNIETSLENYHKALRLLKKVRKLDEIDESEILNSIGSVFFLKDNHDDALTYYKRALDIRKKNLGSHHPETATIHKNIGKAYLQKGELEKAFQSIELAHSIHNEVLGAKHPETTDSLYNLGAVYKEKGDFDKALNCFNEALSINEEIPGEHSIRISDNLNAIGVIYINKGDFDKALEYFQLAKKNNEQVLRKRHPKIAINLYNMGIAYYYKGNYQGAIEYFEMALSIWRDVLGERNSNTADCIICIASILSKTSQYKKSLNYLEQALSIIRETLGEDHPDTAYVLDRISAVHIRNGDYNNALIYSQKALSIDKKYHGDRHIKIADDLTNLGVIYANKAEFKKSLDCLEEALSINKEIFGVMHQRAAYCISLLGEVYQEQGDIETALKYHTKAISIRKKVLGDRHPDTADSITNLGVTLIHKGDYDRAMRYLEQSMSIYQEVIGDKGIKTAVILKSIGTIYLHKGEFDKSLQYLEQSLSILNDITDDNHPERANCLFEVGKVYYRQKKYDRALEFFTQALSIRTHILGKNHPDTIKAKTSLAKTYAKKRIKKKIGKVSRKGA